MIQWEADVAPMAHSAAVPTRPAILRRLAAAWAYQGDTDAREVLIAAGPAGFAAADWLVADVNERMRRHEGNRVRVDREWWARQRRTRGRARLARNTLADMIKARQ